MPKSLRIPFTSYEVEKVPKMTGKCTFVVWGLETCPETGRKHLQGYAEFASASTYKAAQKKLGLVNCHMENAKGEPSECTGYCKKGECNEKPEEGWGKFADDPHETWNGGELGVRKKDGEQGKRFDIIEFKDAIKRRASDMQLLDEHAEACAKFPKFIQFVRNAFVRKDWLPQGERQKMGVWLWGPGGIGKTEGLRNVDYYEKTHNKWWDGYADEDLVLIDDPAPSWSKPFAGYIKTWIQEKPFMGETKGGCVHIRFKRIVIISNMSPNDYFGEDLDEAIAMRYTVNELRDRGEAEAFWQQYLNM